MIYNFIINSGIIDNTISSQYINTLISLSCDTYIRFLPSKKLIRPEYDPINFLQYIQRSSRQKRKN